MSEQLTGKRRLFVEAYLGKANCNKTEAARLAGYASPGQEGHRLFKEPVIQAAINARMGEAELDTNEILFRLREHACVDIGDFIAVDEDGGFRIDLRDADETGKLRLIRKIGYDQRGRPSIEVVDQQAALLAYAKRKALFPERHELTGAGGGPVKIGISYSEALTELKSPAVTPELPEGTRHALPEGETAKGLEATGLDALGQDESYTSNPTRGAIGI